MLAWMDLEMTGLEPGQHVIVEIATIVTDDDLNVVAEGPDIVIHASDDELSAMNELVRNMHSKSGLLQEIHASQVGLLEAGKLTLEFLQQHINAPRTVPLCGNSIGTDRRFLNHYLPEIDDFLHYRSVDVSSVKELCRRWYPQVLEGAPTKNEAHRALGDIRESIAELRYYREHVFVPAVPVGAS